MVLLTNLEKQGVAKANRQILWQHFKMMQPYHKRENVY